MKKRLLAIVLVAATAACGTTQTGVLSVRSVNGPESGPMKDALERGDLLFSRGEYALALDAFRRAVRSDPADAHALNGVAISYAAMGRHDLAREFFELALARTPQDERIYRNFARSLTAQGLRGEAEALLAQAGSLTPGTKQAVRPTLAQLAATPLSVAPAGRASLAGLELERVSLGEVRLRTMPVESSSARSAAQLTTRIVTVAEAAPPVQMVARQLTAPIIDIVDAPLAVAARKEEKAAHPVVEAKPTVQAVASPAAACGRTRSVASTRARLPATGYSIDLSAGRKGADACAVMARAEGRDGLFERLWKKLMRPSGRKDVRG